MKYRLLALVLLLAAFALILSGCAPQQVTEEATGGEAEEPAAEEPAAPDELYVVYVTPSTESGYWGQYIRVGVENGLLDAEEQYGVDVRYEYTGPALESSQDEFMSILEGVIAKQPDAILLGHLAPDAVAPLVQRATEDGIYVNLISIGVPLEGDQFGTLYYCDQPQQGELAAHAFYDAMVEKGLPMDGVVGVHMSVVVPILEEKIQMFVDTLQELAPELTILETQYNENDVNNGISLMEAQLATYGDDLVGFFGGNNVTGDAIVRVIEESGHADTLVGVAVDSDPAEIEGMTNGYLDALVVQTPYAQAYGSGMGAVTYLVDGTEDPDEMNMPASVVTPANMNDEEMKMLLDPSLLARDEQP